MDYILVVGVFLVIFAEALIYNEVLKLNKEFSEFKEQMSLYKQVIDKPKRSHKKKVEAPSVEEQTEIA